MVKLRETQSIKLCAVYINHQLSPNAQTWQQHCEKNCRDLQVEFISQLVTVDTKGGASLEEEARKQRYVVFANLLQPGDILLTGHHQDDQAETLLLQLLRGAGVKGLSAMPVVKTFAGTTHARPLLNFSRVELLQYANENNLHWIEDESNENKKFMRNFIRHELLPLLKAREPAASQLLSRSASHCAEAQHLLEEYVAADLQRCAGSRDKTLSVKQLLKLSPARQRLVLRTWVQVSGFRVPDHRRLNSILQNVLTAKWDGTPCVVWGDVELRRHNDDLFVMAALMPPELPEAKEIAGVGKVNYKFRQGGEVVRIPGRGAQSLKNLFQEWRVPVWERDRIPLLYLGNEIIAVTGYYVHPDFNYLQPPL